MLSSRTAEITGMTVSSAANVTQEVLAQTARENFNAQIARDQRCLVVYSRPCSEENPWTQGNKRKHHNRQREEMNRMLKWHSSSARKRIEMENLVLVFRERDLVTALVRRRGRI